MQQLREQIGTDYQLLDEALSYMEERGRLGGAQMAYRHAGRVITGEAAADPAPAVDLAAEGARRGTDWAKDLTATSSFMTSGEPPGPRYGVDPVSDAVHELRGRRADSEVELANSRT